MAAFAYERNKCGIITGVVLCCAGAIGMIIFFVLGGLDSAKMQSFSLFFIGGCASAIILVAGLVTVSLSCT